MKVVESVEVTKCDCCKQRSSYCTPCIVCGLEYCYNCKDSMGTTYQMGVSSSGYADAYFCRPCNVKAISNNDPTVIAYLRILNLREQSAEFYKRWQEQAKEAEAVIDKLYRARTKQ